MIELILSVLSIFGLKSPSNIPLAIFLAVALEEEEETSYELGMMVRKMIKAGYLNKEVKDFKNRASKDAIWKEFPGGMEQWHGIEKILDLLETEILWRRIMREMGDKVEIIY